MIIDYLLSHPLISPRGIESILNIPKGTIRLDKSRPIPEKYQQPIIDLLLNYGFTKSLDKPEQSIIDKPIVDTTKVNYLQEKVIEAIKSIPIEQAEKKKSIWDQMNELKQEQVNVSLRDKNNLV